MEIHSTEYLSGKLSSHWKKGILLLMTRICGEWTKRLKEKEKGGRVIARA